MPRQPRLDLAHVTQHIVQRGNDRQPCFFTDIDYVRYLDALQEIVEREGCAVHAYVLMTNHVHLLVTPTATGQVARVMQSLGRRYVRHVNDRYHRSGTLWEGRYKACLVDSGSYLLRCYRYIELNPVRASMVTDPGHHPWSSHACNAFGLPNALIQPHASYQALASCTRSRREAYRALVMAESEAEELQSIRSHLQRQHALGADRFRVVIETQLGRRAGPAKIGRPRKTAGDSDGESAL